MKTPENLNRIQNHIKKNSERNRTNWAALLCGCTVLLLYPFSTLFNHNFFNKTKWVYHSFIPYWIAKFESILVKADTEGKETIVLGDFNFDLLSNNIPNKWAYMCNIFNMSQVVSEPTRVAIHSSTLLDHVYCNEPDNISYISVPKYSISDHFPVCFSHKRGINKRKQNHDYITYIYIDVWKILMQIHFSTICNRARLIPFWNWMILMRH